MNYIILNGGVETLAYFSLQLKAAFVEQGHQVFCWDMHAPFSSREQFIEWIKGQDPKQLKLICFNFIGLSGETQFASSCEEQTIWEEYGISWLTILVDHPLYYRTQLLLWEMQGRRGMGQIACVDRGHVRFLEEFYPAYSNSFFLPLAGTALLPTPSFDKPQKRDIDVLFTGNYVDLTELKMRTEGMDEETRDYIFSIIDELLTHPSHAIDEVALRYLRRDFTDASREEMLEMLYSFAFVDLYVRSYYRRQIVCYLAEAGICVHVVGKDWEKAGCTKPENLILHGQSDSVGCLRLMQRAKLSLNLMPWFKEGAHDRIFNGMLQGCAVVTDSSLYLDEILVDGQNALLFSLLHWKELPDKIKEILDDEAAVCIIAREGYQLAHKEHTWKRRAAMIEKELL